MPLSPLSSPTAPMKGQLPVYGGQGAPPVGGYGGQVMPAAPLFSPLSQQQMNQVGAANPQLANQMQNSFNDPYNLGLKGRAFAYHPPVESKREGGVGRREHGGPVRRTRGYLMPKHRAMGGAVRGVDPLATPNLAIHGDPTSPANQQLMMAHNNKFDPFYGNYGGYSQPGQSQGAPGQSMPAQEAPGGGGDGGGGMVSMGGGEDGSQDLHHYAPTPDGRIHAGGLEPVGGLGAARHRSDGGGVLGTGKAFGFTRRGRTRGVVTGGYGARPAMLGRIGYRGALKATPEGGLNEFYNMQNRRAQEQAARSTRDPYTGISVMPTQREISEQLQRIAAKPDVGLKQSRMLSDYYRAMQMGDPKAIFKARQNIVDEQTAQHHWNDANPAPVNKNPSGDVGEQGVATPNAPEQEMQSMDAMPNSGLGEEMPPIPAEGNLLSTGADFNTNPLKREKGGDADTVHPYIVNEEGPEAYQPEGEKPQLMPGGQKMVVFPKDGKVIPHRRTMQLVKEGKVKMPEHRAAGGEAKRSIWNTIKENFKGSKLGREFFPDEKLQQQRRFEREINPPPLGEFSDMMPFGIKRTAAEHFLGTPLQRALAPDMTLPVQEGDWRENLAADTAQAQAFDDAIRAEQEASNEAEKRMAANRTQQLLDSLRDAANTNYLAGDFSEVPPASPEDMAAETAAQATMPTTPKAGLPAPVATEPARPATPTPSDAELLALGNQMSRRGISEVGPRGVKFAGGGGIENGQAYGPHVVQNNAPVQIRPGAIKDELGDVGQRAIDKAENDAFMKRWENDLNSGKAPTTAAAFQGRRKGGPVRRTRGYMMK